MNAKCMSRAAQLCIFFVTAVIAVSAGWSLLACSPPATQIDAEAFIREFQGPLVALCDSQLIPVSCSVVDEGLHSVYTVRCRNRMSSAETCVRITLTRNDRGHVESFSFDRPIRIEGLTVAPRTALPAAVALYAAAHAPLKPNEQADLDIKSARAMINYGNRKYEKAFTRTALRGRTPTAIQNFDQVGQFSFHLSNDTNTLDHVITRADGVVKGKKRNKFKWIATPMKSATGSDMSGMFMATLNKGTMVITYRHKQTNRDGAVLSTDMYTTLHEGMRTNKPFRIPATFGAIRFTIDSECHVATNIPMIVRASRSALTLTKFNIPKRFLD